MTTRLLPPDEWPRLAGTELEHVWTHLDPTMADVLVVEHEGRIVGCWAVIRYVHVEGVWVHPDHRKRGRVALYLLRAMRQRARELGADAVLTGAETKEVAGLIAHLGGTKLPADGYVMPIPPE